MPSAEQCSAQLLSSAPISESQRPLQQTLLIEHSIPSPRHLFGSMHVPATQNREQQSSAVVHVTPCGAQLPETADPAAPAEASGPPVEPPSPSPPPANVDPAPSRSPTLRSVEAH